MIIQKSFKKFITFAQILQKNSVDNTFHVECGKTYEIFEYLNNLILSYNSLDVITVTTFSLFNLLK